MPLPCHQAYPKNAAELEKLKCTLALNPLFMQLDSDDLQIVMDAMRHEAYEARANILQQGQISDCFYVVSSGVCHVHKDGQLVAILKDGQCFGELELMYHSKCRATVNAVTDVELWALGQDVYRQIVMQVSRGTLSRMRLGIGIRMSGGRNQHWDRTGIGMGMRNKMGLEVSMGIMMRRGWGYGAVEVCTVPAEITKGKY